MNKRRGEGRAPAPLPSPSPVRQKLTRKCSLGCPVLDSFLKGGIPCGSITELVGECGSAKTQICLQLLLAAQMPLCHGGLQGSSVYIYTESYFPSRRLQQLARGFVDAGKLGIGLNFANRKPFPLRNGVQEAAAVDCGMSNANFSFIPHQNYESIQNPDLELCSYASLSNLHAEVGAVGVANLQNHSLPVNGGVNCTDVQNKRRNDAISPHKNPKKLRTCNDAVLSNEQGNGEISYVDGELESSNDPCDNVFVQSIQNVEELCVFLEQMHVLLSRPLAMPVKLLVIDSVAALFRSDFDNNAKDLAMRMEWFFKLSSKLKQYAHQYDIAVLVTNQVVDHVQQESLEKQNNVDAKLSGNSRPLISAGRRVIPALGIGWSHCINTRLFVSRTYELDRHSYSYHRHHQNTVSSKSISCRGDIHSYDAEVGCGRTASKPHISVLQQLESELPDDLLLTVSQQRSAESCEAFDGRKSLSYYRDAVEVDKESDQSSLQEMPLSRHNWSMDTENHPSYRVKRTLQVVFAPHLPASSCEFMVKATQVCGASALPLQAVYACHEKM